MNRLVSKKGAFSLAHVRGPIRRQLGGVQSYLLTSDCDFRPRNSRRDLGFFAGVARTIISRVAIATGLVGGTGYYLDQRITEWNENTWGPVKEKIDLFKSITKQGYRDFPEEIKSAFGARAIDPQYLQMDELWDSTKEQYYKEKENSKPGIGLASMAAFPLIMNEEKPETYDDSQEVVPEGIEDILKSFETKLELSEEEKKKLLSEIEALKFIIEDLKTNVENLENLKSEMESNHENIVDNLKQNLERLEGANIELDMSLRERDSGEKNLIDRVARLQDELVDAELRHQKQMKRVELENDELHSRLAKFQTANQNKKNGNTYNARISLVELYSKVLDELENSKRLLNYVQCPDLPRIVVVGDQSSGKTSVLESIARARIFPRGGGQMMTRSPIKVTIAEGRRHIATFPDEPESEYNLESAEDLSRLRNDIQNKMTANCVGKTISSDVISINIKGPGLKRMILVDLPGLISTETAGIVPGTRDEILKLAKAEMDHPKSIILCVQDGSVDAERSQVTDHVRSSDPKGERTLLVLTKVDRAICDPVRLKQILDGKLFPLRALGYFAVVTGMDDPTASINQIQRHESSVLETSELFRSGILKSDQLGTLNMCDMVSKTFWNLVKSSLRGELEKLQDHLFALETEWRNRFRNVRELDRFQLFEKGKEEILDKLVKLNSIDEGKFEEELKRRLWSKIVTHFLDEIYLPSEENASSASEFNTLADIRLRNFTNSKLPSISLNVAGDLLLDHFDEIVSTDKNPIYDELFAYARGQSKTVFQTELDQIKEDMLNDLRVLQQSTVSNRFIQSSIEWESTSTQFTSALENHLNQCNENVETICGPLWYKQYCTWTNRSKTQFTNDRIKRILEKYPSSTPSILSPDQVTRAKYDVEQQYGLKVSEGDVDDVWQVIYSTRWISSLKNRATDCKSCFQKYKNSKITEKRSRLKCEDVVLWWRMNKAVEITAANLRQRMLNEDGTSFLRNGISSTLEKIESDETKIGDLIKGREVELAEEMKFIKNIIGLLQKLNSMLKNDS